MVDKVNELIANFIEASNKHNEALLGGNSKIANKEADRINIIFEEIKKEGSIARDKLLIHTNNSDLAIALMATVFSMKYAPKHCKKVLKKLSKDPSMIGFRAEMALEKWMKGDWDIE